MLISYVRGTGVTFTKVIGMFETCIYMQIKKKLGKFR